MQCFIAHFLSVARVYCGDPYYSRSLTHTPNTPHRRDAGILLCVCGGDRGWVYAERVCVLGGCGAVVWCVCVWCGAGGGGVLVVASWFVLLRLLADTSVC